MSQLLESFLGACPGAVSQGILWGIMALGVAVGLVGIAMVSLTYPLYARMLKSRKKKYGREILRLSDELLNR